MRKLKDYEKMYISFILLLIAYFITFGDFKITLQRTTYTYSLEFNGIGWWLLDSYSNTKWENEDPLSIIAFTKIKNDEK